MGNQAQVTHQPEKSCRLLANMKKSKLALKKKLQIAGVPLKKVVPVNES